MHRLCTRRIDLFLDRAAAGRRLDSRPTVEKEEIGCRVARLHDNKKAPYNAAICLTFFRRLKIIRIA